MNTFSRYLRFNTVGVLGVGVQLVALATLERYLPHRVTLATGLAVELTLVHNFVWHWQLTWRDRRSDASPFGTLLRFQLSNGLVSLVGNVVLMRVLAQQTHMPLLLANLLAILCCSSANFLLGDRWVFAPGATVSLPGVAEIHPHSL